MNKHAALFLLLPLWAWGNELPPAKTEAKPPVKAAEAHSATPPEAKVVSKHAVPQQMTEPIKLLKPAAGHAPAPAPVAAEHAAAAPEVLKPASPPTARYVSPQFSTAKAATHRPVVRSQAPGHFSSGRSHATRSSLSGSYAMKPGLVRVLPAAQIPSMAILPPAKGVQKNVTAQAKPKTNATWGSTEETPKIAETEVPFTGRKIASPKFYSETNPEQRWQYYSYP